jgi:hypothetical protein
MPFFTYSPYRFVPLDGTRYLAHDRIDREANESHSIHLLDVLLKWPPLEVRP